MTEARNQRRTRCGHRLYWRQASRCCRSPRRARDCQRRPGLDRPGDDLRLAPGDQRLPGGPRRRADRRPRHQRRALRPRHGLHGLGRPSRRTSSASSSTPSTPSSAPTAVGCRSGSAPRPDQARLLHRRRLLPGLRRPQGLRRRLWRRALLRHQRRFRIGTANLGDACFSKSLNWTDAIVGVRGGVTLNDHWSLPASPTTAASTAARTPAGSSTAAPTTPSPTRWAGHARLPLRVDPEGGHRPRRARHRHPGPALRHHLQVLSASGGVSPPPGGSG